MSSWVRIFVILLSLFGATLLFQNCGQEFKASTFNNASSLVAEQDSDNLSEEISIPENEEIIARASFDLWEDSEPLTGFLSVKTQGTEVSFSFHIENLSLGESNSQEEFLELALELDPADYQEGRLFLTEQKASSLTDSNQIYLLNDSGDYLVGLTITRDNLSENWEIILDSPVALATSIPGPNDTAETLPHIILGQNKIVNHESNSPTVTQVPICEADEHLSGQTCISNTRACIITNGVGQQSFNGSTFDACQVQSCNNDYQQQGNTCVASIGACSIPNGVGQQSFNGSTYDTCQVQSCNSGYQQQGNTCVASTRACSITNGVGQQSFNGSGYGACQVQSCNSGYQQQSNTCVASTRACSITNGAGQQSWNGSAYDACQVQSCNSGYQQQGNTCVAGTRACSITNGAGQQSWNGSAYDACQVQSCNNGYHQQGSACVSNTRACSITNGVGQQTWNGSTYNTCQVQSCNSGFQQQGNTCVAIVASCVINGREVPNGFFSHVFNIESLPYGESCFINGRNKYVKCENGSVLDGSTSLPADISSHPYNNCTNDEPVACNFDGKVIADGSFSWVYSVQQVPTHSTCEIAPNGVYAKCKTGVVVDYVSNTPISADFRYSYCGVAAPANCVHPSNGVVINHGETRNFYRTPSGDCGPLHILPVSCHNGALSHSTRSGGILYSFPFPSCTPG